MDQETISKPKIDVVTHIQKKGDMQFHDREWAGMIGETLRLEGFSIRLNPPIEGLSVEYMAHLQDARDTTWVPEGQFVGTKGESRRLEGFAIRLTGEKAKTYSIIYRAKLQDNRETEDCRDGQFCGTRGESRRIEAIMIEITDVTNINIFLYLDVRNSKKLAEESGNSIIDKIIERLQSKIHGYGAGATPPASFADTIIFNCNALVAKDFLRFLNMGFDISDDEGLNKRYDILDFNIFIDDEIQDPHKYGQLAGIGDILLKKYQYVITAPCIYTLSNAFFRGLFHGWDYQKPFKTKKVCWGFNDIKEKQSKVTLKKRHYGYYDVLKVIVFVSALLCVYLHIECSGRQRTPDLQFSNNTEASQGLSCQLEKEIVIRPEKDISNGYCRLPGPFPLEGTSEFKLTINNDSGGCIKVEAGGSKLEPAADTTNYCANKEEYHYLSFPAGQAELELKLPDGDSVMTMRPDIMFTFLELEKGSEVHIQMELVPK